MHTHIRKRNSPIRILYLYGRLFSQQLKAMMEYSADFFIMMGAAALTQIVGFLFLWVIFSRIPDIHGWGFWEVAFMYALIYFSEGVGSLFFEGTWRMLRLINMGELDRYLVRPIPLALQVVTTGIGLNGFGNMLIGAWIVGMAFTRVDIDWTFTTVLGTIVVLSSAMVIRVAINFAANCSGFWIRASGNAFPLMVHNMGEFAKYPITIYSLGLQLFVALGVPFAFVSFFPATVIFGKGDWLVYGWFGPLVAVYCVAFAAIMFRIGLNRYESAGN